MDAPAFLTSGAVGSPAWSAAGGLRSLSPGYFEWRPPAALSPAVTCLWARVSADGGDRESLVLPDACTDLIWEPGRGAFVAGPDTGPAPATMAAGTIIVGVRFRPSAGGPALGVPLSELRDQRVDLAELRPADARRLTGTLEPDIALARTLDTAAFLIESGAPDPAVTWAAALLRNPRARAEDVAAEVELSMRQLRRRCHAAVGYGPKTLQRILRFRQFVSRIDAIPRRPDHAGRAPAGADLAVIAADTGYADQAHLTRECSQFAGLTPAALMRQRGPEALPRPRGVTAAAIAAQARRPGPRQRPRRSAPGRRRTPG